MIFMAHECPVNMEIFIDHENVWIFSWCFHSILTAYTPLGFQEFHGVDKFQGEP